MSSDKAYISPAGADLPSFGREKKLSQKIKIIDTTLREGNQAPGVYWEIEDVKNIARALKALGVSCIEVGHPYANAHENNKVKEVVALQLGVPVLAHARALPADILAVKNTGADWVGIFIGINDISLKNKFSDPSLEHAIEKIATGIRYAKEIGLKVRFTLEDASRTSRSLQELAYTEAVKAGADRICYSDTVGILNVAASISEITHLRDLFPDVSIETHFHNDRGLALANALAVKDIADWVSCSVNGIGERCGITDTISFLINNRYENGEAIASGDIQEATKLSKMVDALSRSNNNDRSPVVGKHSFTHCADLHVKAFLKHQEAYCWLEKYPHQKIFNNKKLELESLINYAPKVISAAELKYHRKGPGNRYVMMDERVFSAAGQYCIVREIDVFCEDYPSYVDVHTHYCDSLFVFLGDQAGYKGLKVSVCIENKEFEIDSPASVFIPSGKQHAYKVLLGKGTFINHVLHGNYNDSLLEIN